MKKTLTQNKLLAWVFAALMAVCAIFGVILTLPASIALADDTADRITSETFPDTSTWEEKQLEWQEDGHILVEEGKIYRFNGDLNDLSYSLNIAYNAVSPGLEPSAIGGVVIGFGSEGTVSYDTSMLPTNLSYVTKEVTEGKLYVDFVCYLDESSAEDYIDMYIMVSDGILTDAETYGYMITELVEPTEQTPSETPENGGKVQDQIADFINENTGLALTGSAVIVIGLAIIVYVLFFKKRR